MGPSLHKVRHEFKALDEDKNPDYYPGWRRVLKGLILLPLFALAERPFFLFFYRRLGGHADGGRTAAEGPLRMRRRRGRARWRRLRSGRSASAVGMLRSASAVGMLRSASAVGMLRSASAVGVLRGNDLWLGCGCLSPRCI